MPAVIDFQLASDLARASVHLRAFELLGIDEGKIVTLDFDSTYLRSFSSRRQAPIRRG